MARTKNSDDVKDSGEETKNLLSSLLSGYKEDHYNFVEDNPIKVSTGSLILDQQVSLTEGVHRFCGFTGAGKSSEALLVMKNFLDVGKKHKGFLIKAEGRLSENVKNRAGVKFVYKAEEWDYGSCFVLESNIMESICSMIESLIKTCYEKGERLCIVIDSVDGLRLKADEKKELGSEKVAGPQGLMKRFLARMSLPLQKYGALCICISQVSSPIKLDPYSKEPPRLTSGGGGYGLMHFANYILEFEPRYNGDNILEKPNEKPDPEKNKIIGHWVTVTIKKSDKENEMIKVKYPVKHGRTGGNSIWVEYEICDMLLMWEMVAKKGAWLTFNDSILKEAKDAGVEIQQQHQGMDNLRSYLEENQNITQYFFNKFKEALSR